MTAISDLPNVLLEEVLSRVPITYLRAMRSTSKLWNTLFNDPSPVLFDKASKEIMFVLMYDFRACLLSVNLHNHEDNHEDLVYPFIKEIGKLQQIKISNVFHCNGLLLCLTHCPRLMVWNPYLGHTSWIDPRTNGYSTGIHCYGMGYDSNNNHLILRVSYWPTHIKCEIYDFKSPSWRLLGIKMDWKICGQGVSLKGDNYFIARKRIAEEEPLRNCIICFHFTREIFWGLPPLPCDYRWVDLDALSVVSEEKLAVLCRRTDRWEIWITNKIDSNAVSWSYFLNVGHIPTRFYSVDGSFFVDEKKKVAVICVLDLMRSYKACMVGEGEHYRELDLKEYNYQSCMCSLYVPSLMWIE